jgi:hypothetical protein
MDQLWKNVLQENRKKLVLSADREDILLKSLLDYLMSEFCIQSDQEDCILRETSSSNRIRKLLDVVSYEGEKAFNELCNALETFGTDDKKSNACSMRQSLTQLKQRQWKDYPGKWKHSLCQKVI